MALQVTPSSEPSQQQVAASPVSPSRAPFPASRSTTMMSLRAANLSMEADQALYLEPAALRTVGWMGANGATAVTHDTGAYHADPAKREEARSERVKLARQARAFVEDVETTLDEAGVPMPRGAPGVSPRSSTAPGVGAFSPAFLRLSTSNSALASPAATGRGSRGTARSSAGQSPQQKHRASQQQQQQHRDEVAVSRAVSTLARSVDEEAIASGQMLVSAFDGSAHASAARLFEHNVFVHQRMIAIVDDEESMEADGHIFSAGQSMMSGYGGQGTPSQGAPNKVRGRRPDSIPKPGDWESIPPSVDADGNEIDRTIVEAANRGYNESARNSARRLMAHRCFRKHDFVAEHENSVAAATAAALDSCIADGRAASAHAITGDTKDTGRTSNDDEVLCDAVARSAEVYELAERWTKEATTRGAQEGDAARYDPIASPTSGAPTPKAADRADDVEGAASRRAFAAFVNSAALLMAEPAVSAGPVDRWVRQGRIAALRDVALRVKCAAGPPPGSQQ